jgi:hypothetical protein
MFTCLCRLQIITDPLHESFAKETLEPEILSRSVCILKVYSKNTNIWIVSVVSYILLFHDNNYNHYKANCVIAQYRTRKQITYAYEYINKSLQFLPYSRSIGSFIWLRRHIYMSHVLLLPQSGIDHDFVSVVKKGLQFLPYGRSIGSWICLTHKTYTCHTVQNTIPYDIRFTGMKVRYTIFERVTMYNNAKRTLRKLSTVILL